MTFPASNIIKSDAYSELKRGAVWMKSLATSMRATMAAGDVTAQWILGQLQQIRTMITRWTELSAVPGLAAYAQDQEANPALDIVAEYTTMKNALVAVRDRIINDLPKASAPPGVVGNLAVYILAGNGDLSTMSFTPAQTVNLRGDLDTFIAAVS